MIVYQTLDEHQAVDIYTLIAGLIEPGKNAQ
jgi:hypothetical protein